MTQVIKQSLGFLFILIGLIGILLPVMPGLIFIILGLGLLGAEHSVAHKLKKMLNIRRKEQ